MSAKFFSITSLFTVVFSLCFPSLVTAQSLAQFNQGFAKDVAKQLNQMSIPGASYVIVNGKEIVAAEAFGYTDKTKKQKVTDQTVFRLASVSKPFAATLVMQLAQEGKINLTAPITQFVPDFSLETEHAADQIKVHHVLSHTSGLLPNTYDNLLHENWSMNKIIGRFDRLDPICQPQKCYGYQNILYSFLATVVESSQPQSYAEALQEKVFTPLKMETASVGREALLAEKNHAKPHILIRRKPTGRKLPNGKKEMRYVWRQVKVNNDFYKVPAAAGVNASIVDLAKWLQANMGYAPDVLSADLISRVTTPKIRTKKDLRRRHWRALIDDAHYGYGWRIYQIDDYRLIYHAGWVQGYRAEIGYSPELDIGFAMLLNAESNVISEISTQFWQHVFEQASQKSDEQYQASAD